jgi:hypothetical protein
VYTNNKISNAAGSDLSNGLMTLPFIKQSNSLPEGSNSGKWVVYPLAAVLLEDER